MGEFTIKLNDAELVQTLEEMASIHGQTVEAEIRELLARATEDYAHRLELVRRADAIAALTPKDVVQTDSVEIIREMREERDREPGC